MICLSFLLLNARVTSAGHSQRPSHEVGSCIGRIADIPLDCLQTSAIGH